MCEFDTESRKRQKQEMSERQKEMTYWGWKFEQYVTAGNTFIFVEMGFCLIFGLSQWSIDQKSSRVSSQQRLAIHVLERVFV